jgi:hypothetical protein
VDVVYIIATVILLLLFSSSAVVQPNKLISRQLPKCNFVSSGTVIENVAGLSLTLTDCISRSDVSSFNEVTSGEVSVTL